MLQTAEHLDYEEDFEMEYGIENDGFVIDSPEKANWAICKIKESRQRRDMFNSAAEAKIIRMKDRIAENEQHCQSETEFLLSALGQYIETVPAKETKTQKTFVLPDGKLKKKFASKAFKPDEEALTAYLCGEEEYIKTIKKPEWGKFKKLLKEVDGHVIRTDTGEIVEAVTIEEKPGTFDVE